VEKFVSFLGTQKFKRLAICICIYALLLAALVLIQVIVLPREGVLALAIIIAPYLFLPFLLLAPLACWRRTTLLRIGLLGALLLFGLAYSPRVGFSSQLPQQGTITAMTWNFHGYHVRSGTLRQALNQHKPDIVALQDSDWQGIGEADDVLAHYPYHLYRPGNTMPPGEALLSVYPFLDYGTIAPDKTRAIWDIPRVLWAHLNLGHGRTLLVIDAHPVSSINTVAGCFFCPQRRNAQIQALHHFIQPLLQRGEHILLLGDMNTTDREPAYKELSAGLQDTHLLVGRGSGHSWGVRQLNPLWAILRIDYMLASPNVKPLSLQTDCTARGSEHCLLVGRFAVP